MSVKLYFLRHGQAGSRQDWHGDDAKRPLTAEGKKRMKREAATIRMLELRVDVILCSPLDRALQTAEIVAGAGRPAARPVVDARLAPDFGPKQLAAIVKEHPRAKGLMLVGHEPAFSQTIGHVTGGGRIELKKGSLACVQLAEDGSGTLEWLIPPDMLEG